MTQTIGRFPLKIADLQTISVPHGFMPVSVAPARDTYKRPTMFGPEDTQGIDLWAMIELKQEVQIWDVFIVGTDNELPDAAGGIIGFIGTCVMDNGLVWHVFARPVK